MRLYYGVIVYMKSRIVLVVNEFPDARRPLGFVLGMLVNTCQDAVDVDRI